MSNYNLTFTLEGILSITRMFLDIFIMWLLLYYTIKIIRNNARTSQIFKGIVSILLIDMFAKLLGLKTVEWLADTFVNWGFLAIIIVFQPEIRSLLERLGKTNVFSRITTLSGNEKEKLVDEIVTATMLLSRNQTGALISVEQSHSLNDFVKTGTPINSVVTAELLTSIFVTSTPLHDGAVIIQGDRIACASAYFPSTNLELPSKYGARHRAAIGISEITDSVTIVVSEETGSVSITEAGKIFTVNRRQLKDYLMRVICGEETEVKGRRPKIKIIDDSQKLEGDEYTIDPNAEAIDITKPIPRPKNEKKIDTSVLSKLAIKKQASLEEAKEEEEEVVEIIEEQPKRKRKLRQLFAKKTEKDIEPLEEVVEIEEEVVEIEEEIVEPHEEQYIEYEDVPFEDELIETDIKLPKKKPEPMPYIRNENVRVMGFEGEPIEKIIPTVEEMQEEAFLENVEKEETVITEFDTTKIDVSRILGFDNELSDTFAMLDGIEEPIKKKTVAAFTEVEEITSPKTPQKGGVDNE